MNNFLETCVQEIMVSVVQTIEENNSIYEAVSKMMTLNVGSLVVISEALNIGEGSVLKTADIIGLIPLFQAVPFVLKEDMGKKTCLSKCVVSELIFINQKDTISSCLPKITGNKSWRLIVHNDEEEVVGFLSATDIMKYLNINANKNVIKLGVISNFYGIDITWKDKNMIMYRGDEFITTAYNTEKLIYEEMYQEETRQHMTFLKVIDFYGVNRSFFIDADPVQTNVREVDPKLNNLEDTINWLLDPQYFCRQGDIGFYNRTNLPKNNFEIPKEKYEDYFIKPFHKRHIVQPIENCRFYSTEDGKYFIEVNDKTFIVHPEHEEVQLPLGIVEVMVARGEPLPKIIGLKENEKMILSNTSLIQN